MKMRATGFNVVDAYDGDTGVAGKLQIRSSQMINSC